MSDSLMTREDIDRQIEQTKKRINYLDLPQKAFFRLSIISMVITAGVGIITGATGSLFGACFMLALISVTLSMLTFLLQPKQLETDTRLLEHLNDLQKTFLTAQELQKEIDQAEEEVEKLQQDLCREQRKLADLRQRRGLPPYR
jgi:hypothetical protein